MGEPGNMHAQIHDRAKLREKSFGPLTQGVETFPQVTLCLYFIDST
jgi:hypothetical protein